MHLFIIKYRLLFHWAVIELYLSVTIRITLAVDHYFIQVYRGSNEGFKLHSSIWTIVNFNWIGFNMKFLKKTLSSSSLDLKDLENQIFAILHE